MWPLAQFPGSQTLFCQSKTGKNCSHDQESSD
jgi:hypothetical protein